MVSGRSALHPVARPFEENFLYEKQQRLAGRIPRFRFQYRRLQATNPDISVGWNPASNSEAGGYDLEREGTGGIISAPVVEIILLRIKKIGLGRELNSGPPPNKQTYYSRDFAP